MESDITVYAASYIVIQVVLIAAFGALFYRVLTPSASPLTAIQQVRSTGMIRAYTVREDRC